MKLSGTVKYHINFIWLLMMANTVVWNKPLLPAVGSFDNVKGTLALRDTAGNLVSLASGFLVEP